MTPPASRSRPRFALLTATFDAARLTWTEVHRRLGWRALIPLFFLLLLAGGFGLLSLVPALAPLVYPLF